MSFLEKTKGLFSSPDGEGSLLPEILKGAAGAVVGALPGFLLWLLLGKAGLFAPVCGLVLAVGSMGGCFFATSKKGLVTPAAMIAICAVVIVAAVYYAEKIVWCHELLDRFKNELGESRRRLYVVSGAADISQSEADEMIETSFKEKYGYSRGTFSNVFYHFGATLDALELKGKYIKHMLACYGAAMLGAGGFFAKIAGK